MYQIRTLQNGSKFEVLKNFPEEREAKALLAEAAVEISWTELPYYWWLSYRLK